MQYYHAEMNKDPDTFHISWNYNDESPTHANYIYLEALSL